jgi:hypothetical protein
MLCIMSRIKVVLKRPFHGGFVGFEAAEDPDPDTSLAVPGESLA